MSQQKHSEAKTLRKKISVGGYAFIALAIYGIFFLVTGISHLSQSLFASTGAGDKFWWIAKGLSIILILFITFRIVRKYRAHSKSNRIEGVKGKEVAKTISPPLLSPLLYGIVFVGLPVLAGLGVIAYTIAPRLLQVPNMFMLPIVATALYFALRSAAQKSIPEGKKESHKELASARGMMGNFTFILWLFVIGYYAYAPSAVAELFGGELSAPGKRAMNYLKEKERLGQSVNEDDLPKNTLLDPGVSTSETGKWVAVLNILNPHIARDGITNGRLSPALLDAAKGNPLQLGAGSHISSDVILSVMNSTGDAQDGVFLYNGDCKSPTRDRGSGRYTLKTCTGNWKTHTNSIMGVYALVFNNMGNVFTVDLYEGNFIKGYPDMKLIVHKED